MLIELLLSPLFALINFILGLIPDLTFGADFSNITWLIDIMAFGFWIFPLSLFLIFLANILFWLGVQMLWAIIEFIIKKLPFINLK